ncbi:hypothetical protein [Clostridium sp.]|uniref:hypothetical protein n=1 Tax=Clostridium sp. TaxID=1506 RepID=UPI00260C535F|nr:hypothetical protein [Clostridium sp.]
MIKKVIAITTIMALTLGVTSLAYANGKDDKVVNKSIEVEASTISNQVQDKKNSDIRGAGNNYMMDIRNSDMIDIMYENGYEDLANEVRNGNYKAMDDFMNNITEEDYQKMIDIMRENGYGNMTRMMENIGREEMIEMHNSMGGAESCHGTNGSISKNRNTNRMMNEGL